MGAAEAFGWSGGKSIGVVEGKGKVIAYWRGVRRSGRCTHCVTGGRCVGGGGCSLVLAVIGGRAAVVVVGGQGKTEDRDANAGT